MQLFFQIQNFQLLIFCMDDEQFVANFDYVLYFYFCIVIQVNYFYIVLLYCCFKFLHSRSLLVPYAYVSIEPIDCILLSSLALNVILFTSSGNILRSSLLNLCGNFSINLLFFMNSLWFRLRLLSATLFFSHWFILFSNRVASKQCL